MYTALQRIIFWLYVQSYQILNIFANKSNLDDVTVKKYSADWPLHTGYTGLAIVNLNEYVSLFSHCLVNIQNYQGIEIIGIQSPVYITTFDVANLEFCFSPA